MTRYWTIWPYHPDDRATLDRAWEYDRQNGVTAIGWQDCGDISALTRSALDERVRQFYPEGSTAAAMLWRFFHEIQIGDMILAIRRRDEFVGVGTVTGAPFYHEERGKERVGMGRDFKPNFIRVSWLARGSFKLAKPVLPRQTLAEITYEKYVELVKGIPALKTHHSL